MTTLTIIEEMKSLLTEIEVENSQKSKAAHGRARKASTELKKLAAEFKRTSTSEDKK